MRHTGKRSSGGVLGIVLHVLFYCGAQAATGESEKEIVVTSPSALSHAISAIRNGQNILLKPGEYGAITFQRTQPEKTVTIRSFDPRQPARIGELVIDRSRNLNFEDLIFTSGAAPEKAGVSIATVRRSGSIRFNGNEFHGSVDNDFDNDPIGIRFFHTDEIDFTENRLHNLSRGIVLAAVRGGRISANRFTDLRTDGANFAGVQRIVIEKNFFSRYHPARRDHPDFIQFWQRNAELDDTRDIVIRENVMLQGNGHPVQAIFIGNKLPDRTYRNFEIRENLIYISSSHGVSLYDVDNAHVANNTLVTFPGGPLAPRINVFRTRKATVTANIVPGISQQGSSEVTILHNIVTEKAFPGTGYQPESLFRDPSAGAKATASSFLPRPGGRLDRAGAKRIGARSIYER